MVVRRPSQRPRALVAPVPLQPLRHAPRPSPRVQLDVASDHLQRRGVPVRQQDERSRFGVGSRGEHAGDEKARRAGPGAELAHPRRPPAVVVAAERRRDANAQRHRRRRHREGLRRRRRRVWRDDAQLLVGLRALGRVRDDVRGAGARAHERRHRLGTAHAAVARSRGRQTRDGVDRHAPGRGISRGGLVAPEQRAARAGPHSLLRSFGSLVVGSLAVLVGGVDAEVDEVEPRRTRRHRRRPRALARAPRDCAPAARELA
mmetsp:Transcript_13031/g.52538  ORF Transcript_13031/g.52538 Transcript_13031/m.52538 type:complete len:260 (+) Transcript_13031:730-1509(+)